MAFSFAKRLRERIEQIQGELKPESGFDRSAYGYSDATEEDATFEDVEYGEEESPWHQREDYREPSAAEESPWREREDYRERAAEEESPWRQRTDYREPGAAPYEDLDESPFARAPRREERGRETPAPARRAAASRSEPLSSPLRARASVAPLGTAESERARAASRTQRLRDRLQHPDSLREMFLLREVIDRPVAYRRRRGRAAAPR